LTPVAEAEKAVGIECYATDGAPCAARVKSTAKDFVVEELLLAGEISKEARPEYLPLYRVEKHSIDTMHMARDLSEALRSNVSYGGLKDKRAAAVQYVTPTSRRSSRPTSVVKKNYSASLVGYVPRPMSRAAILGNKFAITLRDCCPEVEQRVEEAMRAASDKRLPNFYGLQRFGTSSAGTHLIGKAIIRQAFGEAVELLLRGPPQMYQDGGSGGQEELSRGEYGDAVRLLPPGRDVERRVAKELASHPGEWVRALRAVPVGLRRLYVQAYQSYLFNKTLSRALAVGEDISALKAGDNWAGTSSDGLVSSAPRGVRDNPTEMAVPLVQLVGYAYRDYGSRFDSLIKEVLENEGISPGQFFVKEAQEVSSEGGFRRPHLAARDASWTVGERTATLNFTLAKGQYATVLLREIIKPRDPAASGLA